MSDANESLIPPEHLPEEKADLVSDPPPVVELQEFPSEPPPLVVPVIPGPSLLEAVGLWVALIVAVVTAGCVLTPFLLLFGNKPEQVQSFLVSASSVIILLLALVFVRWYWGGPVRRNLALRRVSPLHLLLVILILPPLSFLSTEVQYLTEQGLNSLTGENWQTNVQGTSSFFASAAEAFRKFDKMYEQMAQEPWWVVLFAGCLFPAIGEEILFRGVLGRGLVARYGVVLGVLFTSVLFGMMHLHPVQVLTTTVLGVFCHVVYLCTRSLVAPILLHALNNLLAFSWMRWAQQPDFLPTSVLGMDDYPHLLAALALLVALALVVLFYRSRIRWILPDGLPWSPGYCTVEIPDPRVNAHPVRGPLHWPGVALALVAYLILGVATAFTLVEEPKNAWGLATRGNAAFERGDFDQAIADYTKAIERDPQYALAYCNRGMARVRKGDFTQAVADCTQAVRLDPTLADAYRTRGHAHRLMNNLPQAVADCTEAIRINPKDAEAFYCRGETYRQQGLTALALVDCTRAIHLDPHLGDAYTSRGATYYDRREYVEAVRDINKAIQVNPNDAWAYNLFAWLQATCPNVFFRNGREAVEKATKACELSAWKEPLYLATLAAAHAECGEFEEAVRWQQKAANLAAPDQRQGFAQTIHAYRNHQPIRD